MESCKIIPIKEFLQIQNLQIPDYQRPYKWTEKNVNELIDDILFHKNKSAYRLGTLVIHKDEDKFFIVDGQQRTITLTLLLYALIENDKLKEIKVQDFNPDKINLFGFSFSNDISKENIQKNYKVIEKRVNDFDETTISFLLNRCEFVQVILADISEAFQFFDSQNSRGKELEAHDLLKAFHLREMNLSSTEEERKQSVEKWENMETEELLDLFNTYLYRIKNWSKGRSARYFTKKEVDVFKGVSLEAKEDYAFTKIFHIANCYIKQNKLDFPFQIDQPVINGKRFFEMVDYYDNLKKKILETEGDIIETIKTYEGHYRIGDEYVRDLFYCGLLYYIDKFGENDLEKAIEKIFIWAYTLRLKLYSVRLSSIDNYALNSSEHSQIQLFTKIRESIRHHDILNIQLDILQETQIKRKVREITNLFKIMKYYV